jgi:hypothetical protein
MHMTQGQAIISLSKPGRTRRCRQRDRHASSPTSQTSGRSRCDRRHPGYGSRSFGGDKTTCPNCHRRTAEAMSRATTSCLGSACQVGSGMSGNAGVSEDFWVTIDLVATLSQQMVEAVGRGKRSMSQHCLGRIEHLLDLLENRVSERRGRPHEPRRSALGTASYRSAAVTFPPCVDKSLFDNREVKTLKTGWNRAICAPKAKAWRRAMPKPRNGSPRRRSG